MSSSSDFEAARIALGQQLRGLRRGKGLTARALATHCQWHESKVSRIENGKALPSPLDIRAWTVACDAGARADDLIAMASNIQLMYQEWRHLERDGMRRAHEQVQPLWDATRTFKGYAQCLVPGPLQVEGYTAAVLRGVQRRRAIPNDVDDVLRVRSERQRILREKGRSFTIVLEEAALYYRLADRQVMTGQLSRLFVVSAMPTVRLGIIPRSADRSETWPVEDFWIFDDREVQVETVSAFIDIKQHAQLSQYQEAFTRLKQQAVFGSDAYPLIAEALQSM
ncbi:MULTISPECIES: helix-turn-helix domain-containing protein [unclassified Streptomyces]|uniref:helix-turn-helix domain-containing protein n=1 Tax=unclassified Streptomyces TaxID=2593676 RepID=UPI000476B807|nr:MULTISPECIES: helix-turn-helix transcriptional regulator [unclassified Streptomyces]